MASTSIEWTDVVDNIITAKDGGWWCRKISDGCKNCYAARLNQNTFYGGNRRSYSGKPPELILRRDILASWARQRKAKKHFVASMTDVFGEWVPQSWIFKFLDAMDAAPLQTFQVLTKRPDIAARHCHAWIRQRGRAHLPSNIWIGGSIENQETANLRIPDLLTIPATTLFVSCEPLLGAIEFDRALIHCLCQDPHCAHARIHWVITGGESGPGARPVHPDWIRSLRDQCAANDTPFFFKQWGEWCPATQAHGLTGHVMPESGIMSCGKPATWIGWDGRTACPSVKGLKDPVMAIARLGKKRNGNHLDGRQHLAFPTPDRGL